MIWLKLGSIFLLFLLALKSMAKLVECIFNLQALFRELKHPGTLPRSGGGIVFNKKTGKLEATPGEVILPFD